ncbi:uncharacterized protein LOC129619242 [Condylostylus longicornis]|uniref:uncharacterized protein LOC129619242 n=1 Tax=Condylostylus longicornis TaxID=2530218 RepID=UPI00244E2C9C|nr:uncharacterized protein LOC129619242 [Condylostylus longicornis]
MSTDNGTSNINTVETQVATFLILLLGLLSSCQSITISESNKISEASKDEKSQPRKRDNSDQTAAEDKTRSSINEQKYETQHHFKDQTNNLQYQSSFVPSNLHYYTSAATPQVQYVKPEVNQIEYNKLESPSSTVQYTQQYRNVAPTTYQTLSYSGYHPSHAKLATIQYVTSPVSSPAPVHYAADYIGHASVPAVQYAAVAVPVSNNNNNNNNNGGQSAVAAVPAGTLRVHHPVAYASVPGQYVINAHQPSPAQVQLAYAVHIPPQIQEYLKQATPGIQYATSISQTHAQSAAAASAPAQPAPAPAPAVQAAPASTNQHYLVAAAPANVAAPQKIDYSKSQNYPQQVYYAVVPNYQQGYHQGGYAIAVQQTHQPSAYQIQANKQHVLATNSINSASPISTPHVQVASVPAILYKHQQHYIPAAAAAAAPATSPPPAPSPAAPNNAAATSYATFSAHLPQPTPTAAAAIAQQYKAVGPIVSASTTSKPATLYSTSTVPSPDASGVVYQHQSSDLNARHLHFRHLQHQQPQQHRHTPRFIYAAAAQTSPVYVHPPNNLHYSTHLYHPLVARSIISATPPSLGI